MAKYLISASDKITLTPSTAAVLEIRTDWVDVPAPSGIIAAGPSITPGNKGTPFSSAAAADIVPAPGANVARLVSEISGKNMDTTLPCTIRMEVVNATGTMDYCPSFTLQPGEWFLINENGTLLVFEVSGGVKTSAATGRFLRSNILTASGNFTTGPTTNTIFLRMVGGGGGGGGCTTVAAAASAGGGGGAGSYAEKVFTVLPNTVYAFTIGAAGAGNSAAAGGNGGNTTFTGPAAVVVTAPGGAGAPVATALTTLSAYRGGLSGGVATNGDVNEGGAPGNPGLTLVIATPIVASGNGGSSNLGAGGPGIVAVGNGVAGTGYGAGGSGGATGASTVRTGGAGTAGCIIIDEYS